MVRHIVLFRFKPASTDDKVSKLTAEFRELAKAAPGVLSFEYGRNSSSEGKDRGFTHGFVLTFADSSARDAYLPHPRHKEFIGLVERLDIVDEVLVFDYDPNP